ncbi:HEPN domain-containing protein [Thermocladium modestius]|uniref:HEPN domain-containing protein n=1 Tax=Thermocladium modestius TaxID=62609 RepID=UPI00166A7C4E|nr:HEPN domain-containing protein [Thermocladium modestius]
MSGELYREMVDRARHFLKISDIDAGEDRFDISLFHLEQSMQLSLKAYLLREKGDFPRTHGLHDLIELSGNDCVKKLAEEKWYIIDILEDAYIGSRYLVRRYGRREYIEALRFVEEVIKCLNL